MSRFMIMRDTILGDIGLADMVRLRKVEARARDIKARIAILESEAEIWRDRLGALHSPWQSRASQIESQTGARFGYTFNSI